ncbi:hypothetical protein [Anaerosporobacter sp.]|uniref:hypothetical protein n=1 Tax=Anaerosporobacter sp. TaxID=1872529 RepID=UPI00286F2933|nr:hypothetical protein [Anaerosporobacter sp.]
MDFQSNEQDINKLVKVIFQDELQYFNAAFDIVKNEVIPSLELSLDSLNRAVQEYRNGQSIRETRLTTINENREDITKTYFTPACRAIQLKINRYYQFVNEELEELILSLNRAYASAQNMITFESLWQSYEKQLQDCISDATDNPNPPT